VVGVTEGITAEGIVRVEGSDGLAAPKAFVQRHLKRRMQSRVPASRKDTGGRVKPQKRLERAPVRAPQRNIQLLRQAQTVFVANPRQDGDGDVDGEEPSWRLKCIVVRKAAQSREEVKGRNGAHVTSPPSSQAKDHVGELLTALAVRNKRRTLLIDGGEILFIPGHRR
jgi:hypothetical protein